ncbi:hypothetical protein CB0940_01543 [Cercospora beticola]|uniref:C2H2-type domain-containing protein n=1 Tax=Cercospora beticola TaxID=122368 RepID=A0A2G5I7W8_CERBT|nr:hypothetical protein CB0940_01543 [Cercospora beticola]PIB00891.1 hypothetical protein CB0940_01543 [Cercospora beticola]
MVANPDCEPNQSELSTAHSSMFGRTISAPDQNRAWQPPMSELLQTLQARMRFKVLKHLKRHTRPYGCTFPRCNKDFGSRNDWKRHESTQHQSPRHRQVRKQGQNSNLGHGALSQTIGEAEMTTSFWCGFCVAMIHCDEDVTQVQARLGSDSENFLARRRTDKTMARLVTELRIQHVGDHYDKQSRGIKDWVSLDVFVKGEREAEGLGTEVPRLSKEDVVCKQEQEVAEMSWVPGAGLDHKFEQGD